MTGEGMKKNPLNFPLTKGETWKGMMGDESFFVKGEAEEDFSCQDKNKRGAFQPLSFFLVYLNQNMNHAGTSIVIVNHFVFILSFNVFHKTSGLPFRTLNPVRLFTAFV
jgi:hypothetical protein